MELTRLQDQLQRSIDTNKIDSYYPDEGPLRRELYPKHLEFFKLGSTCNERAFIAGNRTGKSIAGAYEVSTHLSGKYPPWWVGKRFNRPIKAVIAGDTAKTSRDILQFKMLGDPSDFGTGMIPQHLIVKTTPKPGIPDAIESIYVQHVSGGQSVCQIKSFDQGREAFQGTEQDVILLDEEVDENIYTECLLRTMTRDGLVLLTFTPLRGLTNVVLSFLPEMKPSE
jgi:phage terminase large subunit-like protein